MIEKRAIHRTTFFDRVGLHSAGSFAVGSAEGMTGRRISTLAIPYRQQKISLLRRLFSLSANMSPDALTPSHIREWGCGGLVMAITSRTQKRLANNSIHLRQFVAAPSVSVLAGLRTQEDDWYRLGENTSRFQTRGAEATRRPETMKKLPRVSVRRCVDLPKKSVVRVREGGGGLTCS